MSIIYLEYFWKELCIWVRIEIILLLKSILSRTQISELNFAGTITMTMETNPSSGMSDFFIC